MLGDLHLVQAEQVHHLGEDHDPGDDRRGAGGVEARHDLALGTCEMLLARLALMTDDERREVPGLHPDRAPTIVAGVAMLIEVLRAFGLEEVEVSEHDILRGAALALAASSPPRT